MLLSHGTKMRTNSLMMSFSFLSWKGTSLWLCNGRSAICQGTDSKFYWPDTMEGVSEVQKGNKNQQNVKIYIHQAPVLTVTRFQCCLLLIGPPCRRSVSVVKLTQLVSPVRHRALARKPQLKPHRFGALLVEQLSKPAVSCSRFCLTTVAVMDLSKPNLQQENQPPATDLSEKMKAVKLNPETQNDSMGVDDSKATKTPKPKHRRVAGLKLKATAKPASSDGLRRFALRASPSASDTKDEGSIFRSPGFVSKELPKLHVSDRISEWRGFELGKCLIASSPHPLTPSSPRHNPSFTNNPQSAHPKPCST